MLLTKSIADCFVGEVTEVAAASVSANGKADANGLGGESDSLVDAGDMFSDGDGVVFSNAASRTPPLQRRAFVHVWDVA